MCEKKFTSWRMLNTHLKTHSNDRPFCCQTCGDSFKTKGALKTHEDSKHLLKNKTLKHTNVFQWRQYIIDPAKELEKNYFCNICGEGFPRQNDLISHEFIHSKNKLFECYVCKKIVATRVSLHNHLKAIHPKEEDYNLACNVCDKKFASWKMLKYHMTTHSDVRPFCCQICGDTFKTKTVLKTHIDLKHLKKNRMPENKDDFEFQCHICAKKFHLMANLKSHLKKTHPDGRPYECTSCGDHFKCIESLKSHHRRKHGTMVYRFECKICVKKFDRKYRYVFHMKKYHGEQK